MLKLTNSCLIDLKVWFVFDIFFVYEQDILILSENCDICLYNLAQLAYSVLFYEFKSTALSFYLTNL